MEDTMQPLKPYEKRDTLRQFLDHDGHVLRFYCVWDDRDSNEFGDVRQVAPPLHPALSLLATRSQFLVTYLS